MALFLNVALAAAVAGRAAVLRPSRALSRLAQQQQVLVARAPPPLLQLDPAPKPAVGPIAQKLCLIDGHGLAYRMHYALQKTRMSTTDGEQTHALHGFLMKLLDFQGRFPDYHMLVAFDLPGPTFRTVELPTYKQSRPSMPIPLRTQLQSMIEACALLGAPPVSYAGFEADDVIATCVSLAARRGASDVVIVSSDKDLLQLVSAPGAADAAADSSETRVVVWNDSKKLELDDAAVEATFGVPPRLVGDLLALMGDASDEIPGVPGIGMKGAAKLLGEHGDLEGVLAAAAETMRPSKRRSALIEATEVARKARRLVGLVEEVPIDANVLCGGPISYEGPGLSTFFERWQLRKVEQTILRSRRMGLSQTLPPPALATTPTAQPAPAAAAEAAPAAAAEAAPAPKKKRGRPPKKKLPVDGEGGVPYTIREEDIPF